MELNVKKSPRNYESVIIIHPDATEDEQKSVFQKNRDIIKKFAGELNHIDTWGKRRLMNPINKMAMGIYFHSTFTAQTECVEELERTMRINDKVLRFLHFRLDDRKDIQQHLEDYREVISSSKVREKEREAKIQARKNHAKELGGYLPRREKGVPHFNEKSN